MIGTLKTLFRAQAAEAEEALIDANGTTLLAQHIRDAKVNVKKGQQTCATLMARKSAEQKRLDALVTEIADREDQARAALAASQDDLAGEIADRIVALEDHKALSRAAIADLDQRIAKLRDGLSSADRRISNLAADLRMARAGEQTRATMAMIATGPETCALHKAEDMANRVRGLNECQEDICAAMDELRADPAGLNQRVKDAGLGDPNQNRRDAILSRLSSKTET